MPLTNRLRVSHVWFSDHSIHPSAANQIYEQAGLPRHSAVGNNWPHDGTIGGQDDGGDGARIQENRGWAQITPPVKSGRRAPIRYWPPM